MDNHFDDEGLVTPVQLEDATNNEQSTTNYVDNGASSADDENGTQDTTTPQFAPLPNWDKQPAPERTRWSTRRKVAVYGSAALAAVTLVTTLALLPKDSSPSANPTDSTKPTATDTASPSPSETISNPPSAGEVLVQDMSVAEMDKLSVKDYAKLPYPDHLAYALDKLPGSAQAYKNVTLDFILQHPDYIPGYFWNGIRAEAVAQSDPIVGAKIAAAELYYTVDNQGNLNAAYQARVNDIEQAGGSHTLGNLIKYVSSTEFKPGVDTNGKPINVMDMTTYDTNPQTGAKLGPETTVQVFEVQIKLSNGTVVPFYPQGYGVN